MACVELIHICLTAGYLITGFTNINQELRTAPINRMIWASNPSKAMILFAMLIWPIIALKKGSIYNPERKYRIQALLNNLITICLQWFGTAGIIWGCFTVVTIFIDILWLQILLTIIFLFLTNGILLPLIMLPYTIVMMVVSPIIAITTHFLASVIDFILPKGK
ncbi:MAG: hypothetical protein RL204_57 [Bacteroidota bacterium]|jgi:hypothetical protein